ncbi:hypothetical protein AURDEDRAFT_115300 [Auricularia subglabra TFB-10046 SS5]|nr:hypothetical protein AURDEDRAFT_115300 [Auricularia subglabra TFB-10046 SS5]
MAPKPVLFVLLALTNALGVVSMSLGISALVKSINEKHKVDKAAPPGVKVDINDSDVVAVGAVLTVGCGFLALACFISLVLGVFKKSWPSRPGLQGGIIGFLSLWILATVIPTLVLARTREAKVAAFLGTTQIPDVLVQAAEKAAGVSRVYWDHDYLRIAAIFPWVTFVFGAITSIAVLTTPAHTLPARGPSNEKLAAAAEETRHEHAAAP